MTARRLQSLPFRTPRRSAAALLQVLAAAALSPGQLAAQSPVAPLRTDGGLVVSQSLLASEAGAAALRRGGNAMDAAVACAFALAATHPEAGNIGGGGFLVVYEPGGRAAGFDFRERAPFAASATMFLDSRGAYDPELHHWSHRAVGVPGTVAGLELAHRRLGRLPWRDVVEPAVRLAADGFPLSSGLAESLASMLPAFRRSPAALAQFSNRGEPRRAGDLFTQPDLAASLERVRDHGSDGFYRGSTAELLVAEMERGGGLITHRDLTAYEAVERAALRGTYRGFEVVSMGPPSSGGIALIEMLNILEGFDLKKLGLRSAAEVHVLTESMRRAFADRAHFLGDPDHVEVPVARLTSKRHAAAHRAEIDLGRASRSSPDAAATPAESEKTTHLSVVDASGMAVSLTTTLEQSFGSRIVAAGTGFLLNNEMGDFNAKPGLTTRDGLIGSPPNLAASGKRMLSSMTPAIVAREGAVVLVAGSPGGRTIINSVLEVAVNFLDHGLPIQEAVDAPRFHHQWLPDVLRAERWCVSPDTRRLLEAMGHRVDEHTAPQGAVMAIAVLAGGGREAGVDRRRPDGGAAAGKPPSAQPNGSQAR